MPTRVTPPSTKSCFARGSNTYLPRSNANQFITVKKCSFLDDFVDILSLTVKIDLPLQLHITHFFASGQTCEIGRGSNTYFPRSNANQFITVIKCSFLDVFVDILSLTVKIELPLQL